MDNNKYEVGITPDDNNNIRLPGSVQPEAIMGAGPYNFAQPGPLDAADTGGVVGMPTVNSGFGMEGNDSPSLNSNVDVHNSDTSLNTTASEKNLSAQYKYPNVSQSYPMKGGPDTQFNDHS